MTEVGLFSKTLQDGPAEEAGTSLLEPATSEDTSVPGIVTF